VALVVSRPPRAARGKQAELGCLDICSPGSVAGPAWSDPAQPAVLNHL
jgi:hypothetical protein